MKSKIRWSCRCKNHSFKLVGTYKIGTDESSTLLWKWGLRTKKTVGTTFWKIYSLNFGPNFLSGTTPGAPTSNAVASGSSSSLRRTDLSEGGRVGSQTWRTRGEDQVIQVVTFSSPIVGGHLTIPKRVTNHHPEKVTQNCQGYIIPRKLQHTRFEHTPTAIPLSPTMNWIPHFIAWW